LRTAGDWRLPLSPSLWIFRLSGFEFWCRFFSLPAAGAVLKAYVEGPRRGRRRCATW
jgi:hypothetical protein